MSAERDEKVDEAAMFRSREDVEFPFVDMTPRRLWILTAAAGVMLVVQLRLLLGYREVGEVYLLFLLLLVHTWALLQPRVWIFVVGFVVALLVGVSL